MWTDVINDLFVKKYILPCNFTYKRVKVSRDSYKSEKFLVFEAHCKDCGSELKGWADSKPKEGESLFVNILTKDTRGTETSHLTKRHLKGYKRKIVGEELSTDVGSNWRRKHVSDMEFGCISPPNLYSLNVLSKTKQQCKDATMGVIEKCSIKSLMEFKYNSNHAGSIYNIGIDPFFVYYWSNHQMIIYKDVCKSYCRLSFDATGGLVEKLKKSSLNITSNNIFLYEAVISTSYGQNPVTQMISKSHDTLSIYRWMSVEENGSEVSS